MSNNKTFFSAPPRADLIKQEFDNLIYQKGRVVLLETALQCPCKSKSTNQQTNCRNCGGTGWIFINPIRTRMVLTAIDAVTDYRPWSEELVGTVSITAHMEEKLSLMDRVTVLDGEVIQNEVLFIRSVQGKNFTFARYDIEEVHYIGLFDGVSSKIRRLEKDKDYSIKRNVIEFSSDLDLPFDRENSITLRYSHLPQFHVVDMKRETMQTFVWEGGEKIQKMPISAIARRAHYHLSMENFDQTRLLDNSYKEEKPCQ